MSHDPPGMQQLQRYRCLIDDWPAFVEALSRPLPRVLWTNTLRTTPERLGQILAGEGLAAEPLPWEESAFRLPAHVPVGDRWWYLAGLAHCQEEASLLPVRLLDPRPGERILDLCAAPGGKTAQIAVALGGGGTVVANDISTGRSKPLRATIERLGLANVSTTVHDGANYPPQAGSFDRILVDAPCSGEGTWRRRGEPARDSAEAVSLRHARAQRALLRKAVQLCRPGGRIVYSTCTFAPEENELVIDAILEERAGDGVQLIPVSAHGIITDPGLTRWAGRALDPSLRHAVRLWPHRNDTGGFFVAVLEKCGPVRACRSAAPILQPAPESDWLSDLEGRFGFPGHMWAAYTAYRQTRRGLHLVARGHEPPGHPRPSARGLFFYRTSITPPKLSTAAAMMFGAHATRNVVDVGAGQLARYLARESFAVSGEQARQCTEDGYVIVRHRGHALGAGLYRRDCGEVQSLFPRRWNGRGQGPGNGPARAR